MAVQRRVSRSIFSIFLIVICMLSVYAADAALEPLAKRLESPDEKIRFAASIELVQHPESVPHELIITLLEDNNSGIQCNAFSALGKLHYMADFNIFANAVASTDSMKKLSAIGALVEIPNDAALNIVLSALDDPDRFVQLHTIYALGFSQSEKALNRLMEILGGNDNEKVVQAIRALGNIANSRAESKLVTLLTNRNTDYCCAAITALCQKKRTADTVTELLKCFHNPNVVVRRAIADQIYLQNDTRIIAILLDALHDRDPRVRMSVCRSLPELEGKQALLPLEYALDDPIFAVRDTAVVGIGKLKDERSLDVLETRMNADPYIAIRLDAVVALANINTPKSIKVLTKRLLLDDNTDIRRAIVTSLGNLHAPMAIDPILTLLSSNSQLDDGLKMDAFSALKLITAQDYGEDIKKWSAWEKANSGGYPNHR